MTRATDPVAPSGSPDAIAVTGLTKSFRGRVVLRGIDLRVAPGELVGIVGRNGAGKSTLLRVLTGLVPRDGGSVQVAGLDPAVAGEAVRARLAYLPGETSIYQQMTGQQFLDFALSFYPQRQSALLDELTDWFALPMRQRVRSYSAGMKQKLALMATLGADLPCYLLDEPDRALDASVRFRLREVLQRLSAQGRTIVLSSHHLSEVESLADRLEFLLDGRFAEHAVIAQARQRLQRLVRVRLLPGAATPAHCTCLAREPGDTLVVEPDRDPFAWLAMLPPGAVRSAEVGIARLEDLYKLLLAEAKP